MHSVDKAIEKLTLGRLRAINLRPYFATAMYRLIPVLTDEIDTLAVDKWWRLYYNEKFVEETEMLPLATSLLHEVEHLLRKHHCRCQQHGFEPELFNYAADCEINDDQKNRPDLQMIQGALLPGRFGMEDGKTAEEYYDLLEKRVVKLPVNLPNCGSGAHGKKMPNELGEPNGDARGIKPEEADMVRRKVAEDTIKYADKHPGKVPGGLLRWAEGIISPKVPWQQVLRGMIRANVAKVAGQADFTYERPNRRQSLFEDFLVPALVEPSPRIAVVIDTSGSMETRMLEQALAEIKGILRSTSSEEGVRVLTVDCALHSSQQVFDHRKVKLYGGGGTDMGVGIEAATKLRPLPDFLICVTDGYTPWPDAPPQGMTPIVVLVADGTSPSWARTVKVAV